MKLEFSVTGIDGVKEVLDQVVGKMRQKIGPALRAEAEVIMADAKSRVPVATGKLKRSGKVTGARDNVKMSFGGGAVDYAIPVHERVEGVRHTNGEAKFLERAMNKAAPYVARNLAVRLQLKKG